MPLTREEIEQIATRSAEEVMDRIKERQMLRDVIIGSAMGEGAIPLYGRETRKEPCSCCLIDPEGPNAPGNRMCTTSNAIGTLKDSEERGWCSEIVIVPDGRCERARTIRQAARECKEKYPEDTEGFFRCYAPAFSKITRRGSSNPGNPTAKQKALNMIKEKRLTYEVTRAHYPDWGPEIAISPPEGYTFDGLHVLICRSWEDVLERLPLYNLVKEEGVMSSTSEEHHSSNPGQRKQRTAYYIQYWSPKEAAEAANPYYWGGAYDSLPKALDAANECEEKKPEAFDIEIYSQEEKWIPDEEDPRFGYWEGIDGTMKVYDRRGAVV